MKKLVAVMALTTMTAFSTMPASAATIIIIVVGK